MGFSTSPELVGHLSQPAKELLGAPILVLPGTGIVDAAGTLGLYVDIRGWNLGLHTWITSTLHLELLEACFCEIFRIL